MDFGSNFDPLKPPKSLKNELFFNDLGIFAGYCFHCSWKPSWLHFGSILGVNLDPKSIQNRFKTHSNNLSKNDRILDRAWDRFCSIFGPNLAPTRPQVGSKLAPKLAQNPTWPNLAPTWPNLAPTWPQLGPNLAPTWPQLGSNLAPKSNQNRSKIDPRAVQNPLKI